MIEIRDNFFPQEEFKALRQNICKHIPFFFRDEQNHGDGRPFFSHTIVERPETNDHGRSEVLSAATGIVKDIFARSGIGDARVFRATINATFPTADERRTQFHCDHEFPYKHLILYLTTHDGASTIIKEDDGREVEIEAVENRVVFFDRQLHCGVEPKKGVKMIIVVTYECA